MEIDECFNENSGSMMDTGQSGGISNRWNHIKQFLSVGGPLGYSEFEPSDELFEMIRKRAKILVIGAGGLGCELLKDLALMGFVEIAVIDMDTIDLSNLNRQFLFRSKDIGRPKAEVAAEFVNSRIPGCNVTPFFNKIQDFDENFYREFKLVVCGVEWFVAKRWINETDKRDIEFNIVVCGLDSIVARRWINGMLQNLLMYDDDGTLDPSTIIPFVDGGTEGFKGNARVILPGMTACIECNLDLFPPQIAYPMCTIAHTPRLPEHCIEYVRVLLWPQEKPFGENVPIDGDNPDHIKWIMKKSIDRAAEYGIRGVTYQLTQGVIKHIIPAVASTNAVIAAMCATEVFKLAYTCYSTMDNYLVFNDSQGVYTYTFQAERKEDCLACSQQPMVVSVPGNSTLKSFLTHLVEHNRTQMKAPGITTMISGKNKTLYMPNIPSLERATRENLNKTLRDLGVEHGSELIASDSTSPKPLICRVIFED